MVANCERIICFLDSTWCPEIEVDVLLGFSFGLGKENFFFFFFEEP